MLVVNMTSRSWSLRIGALFVPALLSFGFLTFSISSVWWTQTIEPGEYSSYIQSANVRLVERLTPIVKWRGLLKTCTEYRMQSVIVSSSYSFKEGVRRTDEDKPCINGHIKCTNGGYAKNFPYESCVPITDRCNQIMDCTDGSDELGCSSSRFKCETIRHLPCADDNSVCFRPEERCNGYFDCMDGSDERNCTKSAVNSFICADGYPAPLGSVRCNGINDCRDGSDEHGCAHCLEDAFWCESDRKCIPSKFRCDMIPHCSDYTDEKFNCPKTLYERKDNCFISIFNFSGAKIIDRKLYKEPNKAQSHANLLYYLNVATIYGTGSALVVLMCAIIVILFTICCQPCVICSYFIFSVLTFISSVLTFTAIICFLYSWLVERQALSDASLQTKFEAEVCSHNANACLPTSLGISFWVCCASALSMLTTHLVSCCMCCHVPSSRHENKEYKMIRMNAADQY